MYFGARFYAPGLARWVSPDPLALHGLGADLNEFGYALSNPVANVDVQGLEPVRRTGGGGGDQALLPAEITRLPDGRYLPTDLAARGDPAREAELVRTRRETDRATRDYYRGRREEPIGRIEAESIRAEPETEAAARRAAGHTPPARTGSAPTSRAEFAPPRPSKTEPVDRPTPTARRPVARTPPATAEAAAAETARAAERAAPEAGGAVRSEAGGAAGGRLRDARGRFVSDPAAPPSPYRFTDAQRRAEWRRLAEDPSSGLTAAERAQVTERGFRGPQRMNEYGELETMELSHEPIPLRQGGTEVVPRWPPDHAAVDAHRHLRGQ
ncbi:MAG: RHS repeat-associated core domain-containing protein [Acidobacteriota bacterium]